MSGADAACPAKFFAVEKIGGGRDQLFAVQSATEVNVLK